jgi:hypothetical protein
LTTFPNIIEKNRQDKKLLGLVNALIAQYKAASQEERYADRNFEYKMDDYEKQQIIEACKEAYGEITWREKQDEEKVAIETEIEKQYQSFFNEKDRSFKKMPHLLDTMKEYLREKFDFLQCS